MHTALPVISVMYQISGGGEHYHKYQQDTFGITPYASIIEIPLDAGEYRIGPTPRWRARFRFSVSSRLRALGAELTDDGG